MIHKSDHKLNEVENTFLLCLIENSTENNAFVFPSPGPLFDQMAMNWTGSPDSYINTGSVDGLCVETSSSCRVQILPSPFSQRLFLSLLRFGALNLSFSILRSGLGSEKIINLVSSIGRSYGMLQFLVSFLFINLGF